MRGINKLPRLFSAAALLVSVLICVVKGISPLTALYRVAAAVVTFYILGFCISAALAYEGNKPEKNRRDTPLDGKAGEEFEELKFPVIETAEKD